MQNLARFGIGNDGAHGHLENNVVSCCTKHVRAHSMLPSLGLMASGKTEIHQSVEAHIGHGVDVTASTTVPAIGAAKLLVLFMTK